jgi:hypothetical protein
MSIKEAAALLEPYCPPGPLVQRYEAIASERAKQLNEARRSAEMQRAFLQKVASFNHDFGAWRSASVVEKNEGHDPTIAVNVAEGLRRAIIPSYILLIAQSHGVRLIDPLSGMCTAEPNEESWIDKDGFEKIWNVLLHHGKRATMPVVHPEARGSSPVKPTISLIEAVHELRSILDLPIRSAISEMIDRVATGQLPPASAVT